jgi:dTDP-4-dehydrorhamnose reductase
MRGLSHAELELTDAHAVESALREHTPDLVINTAAYNRVDDCETQPELAFGVNAIAPHLLARACQSSGATLLHFSTDYVFGGDRSEPWAESDMPTPVSAYGISKLAGELAVRAACPASYVLRVSGLFGLTGSRAKGGNFVETMLRLQAEQPEIRVVDDQVLAPTYTRDLAYKVRELVLASPAYGLYHVTAGGSCSWYEFARAIFETAGLAVNLTRQTTVAAHQRARRPRYSVLANTALGAIGIDQIRPWHEGLRDYLAQRSGTSRLTSAVGAS